MAKPEWGSKRICQSCGAKFYDFDKNPIVCPACSATFDPEAILKSRRGKAPVSKEKAKPVKSKVDEARDDAIMDDDEVELDEDAEEESEDEEVVEDASDLGDDDLEVDVAEDEKEN
ncbi:MAG: TIGR02300 family protein [Tistlia sp.]|uniref:TIGR02300 family protein n=1 Tax=Tistlia sp. TaxID=3057121 RepID=UPI0034A51821